MRTSMGVLIWDEQTVAMLSSLIDKFNRISKAGVVVSQRGAEVR